MYTYIHMHNAKSILHVSRGKNPEERFTLKAKTFVGFSWRNSKAEKLRVTRISKTRRRNDFARVVDVQKPHQEVRFNKGEVKFIGCKVERATLAGLLIIPAASFAYY